MKWCLDGDGQEQPVNRYPVVEQVMMPRGFMMMGKFVMVDVVMAI